MACPECRLELNRLSPLYIGKHRAAEGCDGVPRQRTSLRRLRYQTLRLYQQRSHVTDVRSDFRFVGPRYVCCLAQRRMHLLSHSETVNQAGSFRKRRALDGLVFGSFDSRVHASPRRTKTQHVSAAATELILRRSSTGRDHPPMETGRPEFGHREYLRAYRTDDRVYGLSMGR